ncbi:hypothetical protein Gotur_030943 [Gossypium turneri]
MTSSSASASIPAIEFQEGDIDKYLQQLQPLVIVTTPCYDFLYLERQCDRRRIKAVSRRPLEGISGQYWTLRHNMGEPMSQHSEQNRESKKLPSMSRHRLRVSQHTPEDGCRGAYWLLYHDTRPSVSRHRLCDKIKT